ncbi:hypothetical protein FAI41_04740 [Acetobacteraceae bacterium]|nr:hypothetical protein FAI41_04740 [Acetobacteraceae bacterium]
MNNPILILGTGTPDKSASDLTAAPAGSVYIDNENLSNGSGANPPSLNRFPVWDGKNLIPQNQTYIYYGGQVSNKVLIQGTLLMFGETEITSAGNIQSQTGSVIINYGRITIDSAVKNSNNAVIGGLLETNGTLKNNGYMNVKGALFIDGGATFYNQSDLELNDQGDLEVVGLMISTGFINLYGTSAIKGQTYSKFITYGNINLNYASSIELSSQAEIASTISIADNCNLKFDPPANVTLSSAGSIQCNGNLACAGSLKNYGLINIWGGHKFTCLAGSLFHNLGELEISASANFEGDGKFLNDNIININGAMVFDGDVKAIFGINSIITIAVFNTNFTNNGSITNWGKIDGIIIGSGSVKNLLPQISTLSDP